MQATLKENFQGLRHHAFPPLFHLHLLGAVLMRFPTNIGILIIKIGLYDSLLLSEQNTYVPPLPTPCSNYSASCSTTLEVVDTGSYNAAGLLEEAECSLWVA